MTWTTRVRRRLREVVRTVLSDCPLDRRAGLCLLAVEQERFDEAAQSFSAMRTSRTRISHGGRRTRSRTPAIMTTGHEWNGIKELYTPVPRPVYFFLVVTALFAVGYWILMPAWPLGVDLHERPARDRSAEDCQRKVKQARRTRRLDAADRAESFAAIKADPRLMETVRQTGRTLFGDNCAACHGSNAQGGKGFPNLTAAPGCGGATPRHRRDAPRRHQFVA